MWCTSFLLLKASLHLCAQSSFLSWSFLIIRQERDRFCVEQSDNNVDDDDDDDDDDDYD